MKNLLLIVLIFFLGFSAADAQQTLPFDRNSPRAEVSQSLGAFINVSVEYSRPFVKGRTIFGDLVPYGFAKDPYGPKSGTPWRTGADENTVITFSHDAEFGGESIPAGSYSIHSLPGETEWTIILNSNISSWGSYFYDESLDVIRVTVPVQTASFAENFTISFETLSKEGMHLSLHWAETKVSIPVTFDIHSINLDEYDMLLTNLQGFNPQAWGQAAQYCVTNDVAFDRGQEYAQRAMAMTGGTNFSYVILSAQLHQLSGNIADADKVVNDGVDHATERQLTVYGNWLMEHERAERGFEMLELSTKKNPKSATAHYALAKAAQQLGNTKMAKSAFKSAVRYASGDQKEKYKSEASAL